jgi:DNA gyrase/topoisomerase IV subunit B
MYIVRRLPRPSHLAYEVIANSVDEALAGRCDFVG